MAGGGRREAFPGTVVLHAYAETATARLAVDRGTPLDEGQFAWAWQDLAATPYSRWSGRDSIGLELHAVEDSLVSAMDAVEIAQCGHGPCPPGSLV